MILQVILACVLCFVITAVAGKLLIPELIKLKAGQSIKEVGPTWHMTKQGTPTMGGLMFIIGIGITVVALGWKGMINGDFTHIYVYLFALIFGVIGYIDDYQKVKHHHNTGLTAIQKFLLQLAAAVAFLCLLRAEGHLSPNLYIPFFKIAVGMLNNEGRLGYITMNTFLRSVNGRAISTDAILKIVWNIASWKCGEPGKRFSKVIPMDPVLTSLITVSISRISRAPPVLKIS